jgi:hypothetical protein
MKKQGFVALTLVVTTAAIASSFAPVPRPIESPMTSTSGPAAGNASFEIRHAPVPLLMKPRPPLEQPTFDADADNPALVSPLSAAASDRIGDSAATGVIKVVSFKDTFGANGRYASGHPTAGGTRWAP